MRNVRATVLKVITHATSLLPASLMAAATLAVCSTDAYAADYIFSAPRTNYILNIVAGGTDVIDKNTAIHTVVPFGDRMIFRGSVKYSKYSTDIVHNVRSHLEAYVDWNLLVDLPVDFLRTGPY